MAKPKKANIAVIVKASEPLKKKKKGAKGDRIVLRSTQYGDALNAGRAVLQEVPVYKDGLQPATRELGMTLGTLTGMLNVFVASAAIKLIYGTPVMETFREGMKKKLGLIPEEQQQLPPPRIAAPLLEHYPFVADDQDLRDMFEKLLATAIDKRAAHHTHPSFVESLKQLSPVEARMLKSLTRVMRTYRSSSLPNLRIDRVNLSSQVAATVGTVSDMDLDEAIGEPLDFASFDNLERLGIIRSTYDKKKLNDYLYLPLKNSGVAKSIEKRHSRAGYGFTFVPGLINVTSYGARFLIACVDPSLRTVARKAPSSV